MRMARRLAAYSTGITAPGCLFYWDHGAWLPILLGSRRLWRMLLVAWIVRWELVQRGRE
jgi:hypothetical protein